MTENKINWSMMIEGHYLRWRLLVVCPYDTLSPAAPKKLSLSIFSLFFRETLTYNTLTQEFSLLFGGFFGPLLLVDFFSLLSSSVCVCVLWLHRIVALYYTPTCVCVWISVWNFSENIYLYGICNKNQYIKSRHSNF